MVAFTIIFVDDCSLKTWIYFLKTKDESFSKFQEFKNFVEKQSGRHIHVFRTDNGKNLTHISMRNFARPLELRGS